MTCHKADDYGSGKMTAEELARHVRDCADCRAAVRLDDRLEVEIEALRRPIASNGLWERIEAALRTEMAGGTAQAAAGAPERTSLRARWAVFAARRWPILVPAGALLAGLIILGIWAGPKGRPGPSGILERKALAEVEVKEREYIAAIENLERRAEPRIAAMEEPRFALYKEKLATIDAQIGKCRQALAANPANAHIRRYLLAALQDKERTLADVMGTTN